jgi:hypothetical protein
LPAVLTSLEVKNDAFKQFLRRLKPLYQPPSRKSLAGALLDDAYAHTKLQMDRILAKDAGQLTLVSNSWSNQRSKSVTNYLVTSRQHLIFIRSEVLGAERHTSEVIARGLSSKIDKLGGRGAVVAVTITLLI